MECDCDHPLASPGVLLARRKIDLPTVAQAAEICDAASHRDFSRALPMPANSPPAVVMVCIRSTDWVLRKCRCVACNRNFLYEFFFIISIGRIDLAVVAPAGLLEPR